MGQLQFGCNGRTWSWFEPVHNGRTLEPGMPPDDVNCTDPADHSPDTNTAGHGSGSKSDIRMLHATMLSMEGVMKDLQSQLLCMSAAKAYLCQSKEDTYLSDTGTCSLGIESDIHTMESVLEDMQAQLLRMSLENAALRRSHQEVPPTGTAEHNSNIKSGVHVGPIQGVVEGLHKLQDLRDELGQLRAANGTLHETNVTMKQSHAESDCEEWRKFDILVEHYRKVDQHRRACQMSSMSEGSTATSVQDGDSSAGSELALEDAFDVRLNTYEVAVGPGSNDATARIALPMKEPCTFFQMTPRYPPLEVVDCHMTPRGNVSLEVLDYEISPRSDDSIEVLD